MDSTEFQDDAIRSEVEGKGAAVRRLGELSEADYRARPEWSVSQFKSLPAEPELFYGRHVLKLPDYQQNTTPQMALGTALHETLLQGVPIRVIPRDVLSASGTKAGGKWKAFAEEHAGETWLKEADAEPIKRAAAAVYANPKARALLELPGDNESAVFWRDEYTALDLRGRLDKFCRVGNGLVVDIKTANDPTEIGFPFACLDRKYHVQAAAYMQAIEAATGAMPESFLFIAVQVEPPYVCQVYACRSEMIELGFTKMREALADLKCRLDSNDWHRAGHGQVNILDLPKKAYQF